MTEARVPRLPVDEAKAAADEAGVPNYMAELSIFQVLLNHPALAGRLNDLLALMLWHGKLDSRLRELVIMRIGWLTASDYEWTQHWRVAQGLGVSADDLLGVRDWQSYKAFGPAERAVLAATDDVVRDGAVSEQSWAACKREFGADQALLIELVAAISGWRMIASILHSLAVPLEDGVASWPPDGRAPTPEHRYHRKCFRHTISGQLPIGPSNTKSVCGKSSPTHSSDSPASRATAYVMQSPKLSAAGCLP